MTKIIYAALGVLAVVVIVLGVNYFGGQALFGASGTGTNHYQAENFLQGLVIGQNGSLVNKFDCNTQTWNPPSLTVATGTTPASTTDISVPGAVLGDICEGSLTSATTTGSIVNCSITATATATLKVFNISTSNALDYATGTAQVCYKHIKAL